MHIDFKALYELLNQQPAHSYTIRQRLFHSRELKDCKLWFTGNAVMLDNWSLCFYGEAEELRPVLEQLPPGKYGFFAVPDNFLPLLEEIFTGVETETHSNVFTLSDQDFPRQEVEQLDSLTEHDVDTVNQHWDYRFEGSQEFFSQAIANYHSSAIRIDGNLVGWSVCYSATDDMANLGSLRVLDPWLRQGFGRKLALDLAAKVLDSGRTPLIQILTTNTASRNLSLSIGFRQQPGNIFWGAGIKPCVCFKTAGENVII